MGKNDREFQITPDKGAWEAYQFYSGEDISDRTPIIFKYANQSYFLDDAELVAFLQQFDQKPVADSTKYFVHFRPYQWADYAFTIPDGTIPDLTLQQLSSTVLNDNLTRIFNEYFLGVNNDALITQHPVLNPDGHFTIDEIAMLNGLVDTCWKIIKSEILKLKTSNSNLIDFEDNLIRLKNAVEALDELSRLIYHGGTLTEVNRQKIIAAIDLIIDFRKGKDHSLLTPMLIYLKEELKMHPLLFKSWMKQLDEAIQKNRFTALTPLQDISKKAPDFIKPYLNQLQAELVDYVFVDPRQPTIMVWLDVHTNVAMQRSTMIDWLMLEPLKPYYAVEGYTREDNISGDISLSYDKLPLKAMLLKLCKDPDIRVREAASNEMHEYFKNETAVYQHALHVENDCTYQHQLTFHGYETPFHSLRTFIANQEVGILLFDAYRSEQMLNNILADLKNNGNNFGIVTMGAGHFHVLYDHAVRRGDVNIIFVQAREYKGSMPAL